MENTEKQKDATNKEVFITRMKTKYPEDDFTDEEVLFGKANADYDENEKSLEQYRKDEKILSDLFTSDPRSAAFLSSWKSGEDPVVLMIERFGDDFRVALDDPEKAEKIKEAQKKYLDRIANEKKLFIFEAITVLHNEVFYEMKKNLNKLGNIRMALCNYSQYSSRYDAYLEGDITHSFDPAYYGGSLYDINVYNIHYCVGLFGEPKDATYYPNIGPNGIDTSGTLVMEYDGFSAVCTGSKDSDSPGYVCVQGEKGFMKVDSKPNIASELKTVYADENIKEKVKDAAGAMVRATITEDYKAPEHHHRMTQEFIDFARVIDEKDYETAKEFLDETVAVVKVLETARKKAGIEF